MAYIHDSEEEYLYALPQKPTITSKNNRNGDRKAWVVTVDIEVCSPNNHLGKKGWVLPLNLQYKDEFPAKRKEDEIVKLFQEKYYPTGQRIGRNKYLEIKQQYDLASGVDEELDRMGNTE